MSFARPKTAFVTGRSLSSSSPASAASPDSALRRPKTAAWPSPGSSTAQARGSSPGDHAQVSASLAHGRTSIEAASPSPQRSGDPASRRPKTAGAAFLRSPPPSSGSPRIDSPLASTRQTAAAAGGGASGSPLLASRSLADVLVAVQDQSASCSPSGSPRPPSSLAATHSEHIVTITTTISPQKPSLLKESALLRDSARVNRADLRTAAQTDGIAALRTKSNETVMGTIRNARHEAALMHQAMLRLGEEQKLLGKSKSVLEVAVQGQRKGLSINHQSQALRQKMSSRDQRLTDSSSLALANEARQLSQSKRDLERQLAQVKSQQWEVDKLRKTISSRAHSINNGALTLDSHHEKMFSFPKSSQERYSTIRRKSVKFNDVMGTSDDPRSTAAVDKSPLTMAKGSLSKKLLQEAQSLVEASRVLREESKSVLAGVSDIIQERRDATKAALRETSHNAHLEECELAVERGRVRTAQSASLHAVHVNDHAANQCRGPIADEHWSVAEKSGRPLIMAAKPEAAEEERRQRGVSYSAFKGSGDSSVANFERFSKVDSTLALAMRQKASHQRSDLEALRLRRRGADNRWVQG